MPFVTNCKNCGREFQIQGLTFANDDKLKTAHTTDNVTEERCSHCSYIATYSINELLRKN